MRKLNVVIKNELIRYFTSPLAYVYLLAFLLLNSSFAFYFGAFFARGQANLSSMFAFQPWLYLIFIPGIAMRLWSEEFRTKTIIQIITQPVSLNTLVWGKFFAAWIFIGLALVLTFPFWITVNILGSPDNTVIAIAYLSSFLIAGCILAISSTMSALTKNQVIALVLSVFANLLFFLSGLEFVLSIIRTIAPPALVDMFASFSFLTHFNTMTSGLVGLNSIIFIVSLITLFNLTTTLIISFKTSGTSKIFKSGSKNYYILAFVLMLLSFVGLNLIANNSFRNIEADFTEEKLFTITPSTKKILHNMPNNVIGKLYYSPILGQRNPDIRLMFDRIRILLDRYESISNGKFTYKIYTPEFLDRNEDEALTAGLQPVPIIDLNQNAYFGLSLSDDLDNKQTIPFFILNRQNLHEHDITQKIYQLYHKKKTIGIISSLNIESSEIEGMVTQRWEILNQITKLYDIKFIKNPKDFTLNKFDILMLIHPKDLSAEMISEIKKHNKLFIALDGATETVRMLPFGDPVLEPSDLKGLDSYWGFKFHNDLVIADLDNSIMVDETQNYQTTPKFTQDVIQPRLHGDALNRKLAETKNLKSILLASISPISQTGDNIHFIPLLRASKNSSFFPIDVIYDNIDPGTLLKNFTPDQYNKIISARILSKDTSNPFDLIVIGDTDFLYDSFWSERLNILNNQYTIPLMDNANFVLNALDVLTEDTDLIELRGKSADARTFVSIEKIRKSALKNFSDKERDILNKIEQSKHNLQEVWNKKQFENREIFSPDELAVIAATRKNLDTLRQDLSVLKINATKELRTIEAILKLINIYTVPSLIILLLLCRWVISLRRNNPQKQHITFNRELRILTGLAVTLLAFGVLSVYISDKNTIDKYENKPVFMELKTKVNDIQKISIKSHDHELSFIKQEGIWKLEQQPDFPVYQERIRSFLSALLEASYYEKKSDKVGNLAYFGLLPIEEPTSSTVQVSLLNDTNKSISTFEVGKYDIELGRGSRGAYIKFPNKFQVWLIAADFIDLSANWQDWTYNTLWNLRFGRISNIKDVNIVKELLNIHMLQTSDIKAQSVKKLNITNESGTDLTLEILQKNNTYFASYTFPEHIEDANLKLFSKYTGNKLFELDPKDNERIKNVIK